MLPSAMVGDATIVSGSIIILDSGRGWVQISVLVSPYIGLLNSLYLPISCIELERRLTFCLHATPPIDLSMDLNVRCFTQTFHHRMFLWKNSAIECFVTSDSVLSKIVGLLLALQQDQRELLDFSKPIKMLKSINVETNVIY